MRGKSIAIGLISDRTDVLLCHGARVVAGRRIDTALESDPSKWTDAVRQLADAVRAAATELGGAGLPTIVLYRSPTQCVDYTSLALRRETEAQQAAILACADSLSCPLDLAVCEAMVVGRDARKDQPQTHVVVAADHDQTLAAIASMVEAAGLRFEFAVPLDAAIMARWIRLASRQSEVRHGYLYVGEHRSCFVIAGQHSLDFSRSIGLGIDALCNSLTLPIRSPNAAEPIQLTAEAARRILHQFGFPEQQQVIDAQLHLTGAQILPLLQPVLQRYIVELRQSLRFGLPEAERSTVEIVMAGPGSAIPGFAALLAHELRLNVVPDGAYRQYDDQTAGSPGSELVDAASEQRRTLEAIGLKTQQQVRREQQGRLKHWLWTGAAAALLLIGLDAAQYHVRLTGIRQQVNAIESSAAEARVLQDTGERILSAIAAMDALEATIARETGADVNIRACLHELSRLAGPAVRVSNLQITCGEQGPVGVINGYAFDGEAGSAQTQLQAFVARLSESPLFDNVTLAHVQAGAIGQRVGQRFETSFVAVSAPPVSEVVASAAVQEHQP